MKTKYQIYVQTKEDYTGGVWIRVSKSEFAKLMKEVQSKGNEIKTEKEFYYTWYIIDGRVRACSQPE